MILFDIVRVGEGMSRDRAGWLAHLAVIGYRILLSQPHIELTTQYSHDRYHEQPISHSETIALVCDYCSHSDAIARPEKL